MRILEHAELSSEMERQVHLLDASAGWGVLDFQRARAAVRLGYPAADYFAVYAVEDGEVVSAVRVLRLPYSTHSGVETVSAIAGVVTRRDRSRQGFARKLLQDVHEREKAAGYRFAMLWTGRGTVAHGLYKSLGYVDVHVPELAVRRCEKHPEGGAGYTLTKFREDQAATIERLHAAATEGRVGYTPRAPGLIKALFKTGFLAPGGLRMIVKEGEPLGYVAVQENPGWIRVDEVTVPPGTEPDGVLSLLESEAGERLIVLKGTYIRDALKAFRRRGYRMSSNGYHGLLARPLTDNAGDITVELGVSSKSFVCQGIDYF